jgi:hypothetical protein
MSKTMDAVAVKAAVKNILDDVGIALNSRLDRGEKITHEAISCVIDAGYHEVMTTLDKLPKAQ